MRGEPGGVRGEPGGEGRAWGGEGRAWGEAKFKVYMHTSLVWIYITGVRFLLLSGTLSQFQVNLLYVAPSINNAQLVPDFLESNCPWYDPWIL